MKEPDESLPELNTKGKPLTRYNRYYARHKEKAKVYYIANKDKITARNEEWRRNNRGKVCVAAKKRYDKNPKKFVEASVRCARKDPKKKAYMKKWRSENKDKIRAATVKIRETPEYKAAAVHRAHVRTARKNNCPRPVTKTQLTKFIATSTTCHYCQRSDVPMTVDHFIPLSKGGAHSLDNIVAACKPCNSSKRDRDPHEFISSLQRAA